MRTFHRKLVSWAILVVMLTVTVHCVCENAHAMQSHMSAAGERTSDPDVSVPHQCPCSPLEHHNDSGDCDTCYNCACHTPLTIQPFRLSYNPFILELSTFDLFKQIPEVYLSKFVPPQIPA